MAGKANKTDKATGARRRSGPKDDEAVDLSKAIHDLRIMLQKKLGKADYKPSVADFLKLLQLEQEFEERGTKELTVTWVNTPPSDEGK